MAAAAGFWLFPRRNRNPVEDSQSSNPITTCLIYC